MPSGFTCCHAPLGGSVRRVSYLDPERARVFGAFAEDYERWRPGYPSEAVDWLVPPQATRVVDAGAGTGKLTGLLLARGLQVVAVEPDAGMLAVLARVHPDAGVHLSGADQLLVGDASVDAVLVAQAWHWFPHEHPGRGGQGAASRGLAGSGL